MRDSGGGLIWDSERGWVSVAEFETVTLDLARRLHHVGLERGDRVIIAGSASIRLVEAHIAAIRAGLAVVPVNPAYREPEVGHIAADARPACVISDSVELRGWVAEIVSGITEFGLDIESARLPADALLDDTMADRTMPEDVALITYTSGTTGRPKGAALTHANVAAGCEALIEAWGWTPGDRLVLALPLFHMHGLGVGVHTSLHANASMIVLDRFSPAGVAQAAREHAATMFFGVPTMYARFASDSDLDALARLKLCVSGSAPLAPDLFRRLADAIGTPPLERYGMSETMMLTSNPLEGERRAGSVGLALPGVELALRDGEVCVRGPNVFAGYWNSETPTLDSQGWFATGDLGVLDDDGYLFLRGRKSELIISGGHNVYPREIENVLREHAAVHDAAVIGMPSDEWGETVAAVLEGDPVDAAALAELCGERLAPYKQPRQFRWVDALPRNAMGKVVKGNL